MSEYISLNKLEYTEHMLSTQFHQVECTVRPLHAGVECVTLVYGPKTELCCKMLNRTDVSFGWGGVSKGAQNMSPYPCNLAREKAMISA